MTKPAPTLPIGPAETEAAELTRRLSTLRAELVDVEAAIQKGIQREAVGTTATEAAERLLAGDSLDSEEPEPPSLTKLTQRRDAIEAALRLGDTRITEIHRQQAVGRYNQRRSEHDEIIGRICDAVAELAAVMQQEYSFRAGFPPIPPTGFAAPDLTMCPWLAKLRQIDPAEFRARQVRRGFAVGQKDKR